MTLIDVQVTLSKVDVLNCWSLKKKLSQGQGQTTGIHISIVHFTFYEQYFLIITKHGTVVATIMSGYFIVCIQPF